MQTKTSPAINQKALEALRKATNGYFSIRSLAGDDKRITRAIIMSLLCGRKMPVHKSGITALEEHFYIMASLPLSDCSCIRDREMKFTAWAKSAIQ